MHVCMYVRMYVCTCACVYKKILRTLAASDITSEAERHPDLARNSGELAQILIYPEYINICIYHYKAKHATRAEFRRSVTPSSLAI